MTHPKLFVTVDGVPVSGLFFEYLISLTVTDREGARSDALDLTFNDPPLHFVSPRRGAVVKVVIQHGLGGSFTGAYVVDRVAFNCLPFTISVTGHSADLRQDMKTSKTRHWDATSVGDIVRQIAGAHGLTARVSAAVAGHVYQWIGQQDESDLHFLERLATRHGALFTIKNGRLLWLERGRGTTADGTAVAPLVLQRSQIVAGSCKVSESDVERYARVKAYWKDHAAAKRREVVVDADPEGKGEHVLREPFSSEAEARSAAQAAAREMVRGLVRTSCTIIGQPGLVAGQPVVYAGVRPLVDGRTFILETVQHSYSKSGGLRTSFDGKLKAD